MSVRRGHVDVVYAAHSCCGEHDFACGDGNGDSVLSECWMCQSPPTGCCASFQKRWQKSATYHKLVMFLPIGGEWRVHKFHL